MGDSSFFARIPICFWQTRMGRKLNFCCRLPIFRYPHGFSPDSKRIRVTLLNQKTGVPAIWELNRDGSNLHRLLPDSGGRNGECCGRWTADGHYYIFIGANNVVSPDPILNVFALPDVSGKLRRTSRIPVQLT